MATVKFQLYMEPDSAVWIQGLGKVYGWTPTQVVDRLLRYYLKTRALVDDYQDIGDGRYAIECEDGTDFIIEGDSLLCMVKSGLAPERGFGDIEVFEKDEDNG